MKYKHVVLGGTFDRFHAGHRALVQKAFSISKNVAIGLTSDKMVQGKKFANVILSYKARLANLREFLSCYGLEDRAEIIAISDKYGHTLQEKKYEAIVVSPETKKSAVAINYKRRAKGLPIMKVVVVRLVMAEDRRPISSERIRAGEIDREGKVYKIVRLLKMPDSLRDYLRRPLGEVIEGTEFAEEETSEKVIKKILINKPVMTVAIGDIISLSLIKKGFYPDVSVIDFRSRRKTIENARYHVFHSVGVLVSPSGTAHLPSRSKRISSRFFQCINNSGTINPKAAIIIKKAIENVILKNKKSTIIINGEEDLLTLPAILFAPLGTIVLYGQYDLGVIIVYVTEEKKKEALSLLQLFK